MRRRRENEHVQMRSVHGQLEDEDEAASCIGLSLEAATCRGRYTAGEQRVTGVRCSSI